MIRAHDERWSLPLALLAVAGWSSSFIFIATALREVGPGAIVLARFGIASLCFAAIAVCGRIRLPDMKDIPALASLSLIGQAAYQFSLVFSQTRVSPSAAGVLIGTVPAFTAMLASWVLGERLGARGWVGLGLAFAGVVCISAGEHGALHFEPFAALSLLAALCSAVYFVLQKPYMRRYSALDLTAYGVWASLGMSLLFAPALRAAAHTASPAVIWQLIYLGVVPTAICYTLWSAALRRGRTARVASTIYLEPLMTIVLAWLLLGERPNARVAAGAGLVLAGVAVVQFARLRIAPRRDPVSSHS